MSKYKRRKRKSWGKNEGALQAAATVVGTLFLVLIIFGYLQGSGTDDWSSTEGKVLSLELKKKWPWSISSSGVRGRNTLRGPTYSAIIQYSYSIDSADYTSSDYRINALGFAESLDGTKSYLEGVLKVRSKFAPGSRVEVFFNPNKPNSALLQKGYQGYLPTYLIVAALLLGYGAKSFVKRG